MLKIQFKELHEMINALNKVDPPLGLGLGALPSLPFHRAHPRQHARAVHRLNVQPPGYNFFFLPAYSPHISRIFIYIVIIL